MTLNGQTIITIPVDLDSVQHLGPGDDWSCPADGICEVYVVRRDDGRVTVKAFAIRADLFRLVGENVP